MSNGYIYCLSNDSMPGLLKIGEIHTDGRTPEDRVRELYTTGVPLPFTIEFAKKVANPAEAEARIHAFISDKRVNPRREFFKVTPEYVRRLFDLIDGEMWVRPEQEEESDDNDTVPGQGSKMQKSFVNGLRIRHMISRDPNKTWIGTYNATTDRIVHNDISYTSPSNFGLIHNRLYSPDRKSTGGWVECECEVDGIWVNAGSLKV